MRNKYKLLLLVAVALVTAGCNQAPYIPIITPSATNVESGDIVVLTCAGATDPDGDPITYLWSATGGTFNKTDASAVQWTAPDVVSLDTFTITLELSDPDGKSSSADVDIKVAKDTTTEDWLIVTIGSQEGSATFPFNSGNYGRSQFLYYAEEIDTSGKIVKMAIMPSDTPPQHFESVKIWFVPVTADSLIDTLDNNYTGAAKSLVCQEASVDYGTKDSWFEFVLDNPFNYAKTTDLMIEFEFEMFSGQIESPVPSYAFGAGSGFNRYVGIVRSEDGFGTPHKGALYLMLYFEK